MNSDWDPTDKPWQGGIDFDYLPEDWPVSLTGSLFYATTTEKKSGTDVKSSIVDGHFGARKIWAGRFAPYAGGGLALTRAAIDLSGGGISESGDAWGAGLWAGAGGYFDLSESLHIGVDARYSWVNVKPIDSTMNAGGFLIGATIGYHWETF